MTEEQLPPDAEALAYMHKMFCKAGHTYVRVKKVPEGSSLNKMWAYLSGDRYMDIFVGEPVGEDANGRLFKVYYSVAD